MVVPVCGRVRTHEPLDLVNGLALPLDGKGLLSQFSVIGWQWAVNVLSWLLPSTARLSHSGRH